MPQWCVICFVLLVFISSKIFIARIVPKKKKKKTLHSVVPVNFLRQFSCDVVLRKNFIDSKLGKKIAMTRWKIEMVHEKYQIPKSLWFNKILIHL